MSENGEMKRTKLNATQMRRFQTLSALTTRLALAGNLGLSHGGERDIYNTLGYPLRISSDDLIKQWRRQDIARAIVDRPVKKTWQGDVFVTEPDEEDETEIESAYKDLDKRIGLKSALMRADRLSQLGDFAVLLLGFDDSSRETWPQPIEGGERSLMYARPISQSNVDIATYETDPSNPRFGKPRLYNIELEHPSGDSQEKTTQLKVHYSRVIHIAYDLLESEIEGEPIMKTAYNRLKDLEKLVGGSAEMFWRGARPGYFSSAKEGYTVDDDVEESLRDQLEEYEHGLRRFLAAEGIDVESLAQQVSDPEGHFNVLVKSLSALTGIPARVLMGAERGELASSQDQQAWKEFIHNRRTEEVEPIIIRPFVDKMIEHGVLPTPGEEGYSVSWSDLFTLGEKEKAEVGSNRASALANYVKNPVTEQVVPLEAFLTHFLHMTEDQVTNILEMRDTELDEMLQEEADLEEELEQQEPNEGEDND